MDEMLNRVLTERWVGSAKVKVKVHDASKWILDPCLCNNLLTGPGCGDFPIFVVPVLIVPISLHQDFTPRVIMQL